MIRMRGYKSNSSRVSLVGRCLATFSALLLVLTGILLSQTSPLSEPQKTTSATAAIVLGLGSPNVTAQRSGTSIGIVAGGSLYLFDAGAGVERRIMEAGPQLAALGVLKLGPVFITHLDPDHTIGLAALFIYHQMDQASNLRGGAGELTVYGPGPVKARPGIGNVMDHIRSAFFPPLTAAQRVDPDNFGKGIRVDEISVPNIVTKAVGITPGVIYQDANVKVTAFEVAHHTPIAYGFRVQTADRVIVISGDTSPVDAVIEACNGCDLLFHELFGLDFGPSGPRGAAQGHTSAIELGEVARRARPNRLVIYHDVNYGSEQAAIQAIKKSFSGEVTFARDLDVF